MYYVYTSNGRVHPTSRNITSRENYLLSPIKNTYYGFKLKYNVGVQSPSPFPFSVCSKVAGYMKMYVYMCVSSYISETTAFELVLARFYAILQWNSVSTSSN